MSYADLVFHAQYWDGEAGYEERALKVWVTPSDSDQELMALLYQLSKTERPVNQAVGGHGFTGLHYVYHPHTEVELQFWCSAE